MLQVFIHLILATKSNFCWRRGVEDDKLDISKLLNVPPGSNNIKTKKDDLDVGKLKTVPLHLKKLSDAVSKEIVIKYKST